MGDESDVHKGLKGAEETEEKVFDKDDVLYELGCALLELLVEAWDRASELLHDDNELLLRWEILEVVCCETCTPVWEVCALLEMEMLVPAWDSTWDVLHDGKVLELLEVEVCETCTPICPCDCLISVSMLALLLLANSLLLMLCSVSA